jgi:hypothetical protein
MENRAVLKAYCAPAITRRENVKGLFVKQSSADGRDKHDGAKPSSG